VVGTFVVIALAAAVVWGALAIYGRWQSTRQQARVEIAVRATFPQFCAQPGEHLWLERDLLQWPWQFQRWTVACRPSPFPWREVVMVINLSTCTVEPPIMGTDEGHRFYGDLYKNSPKLSACP